MLMFNPDLPLEQHQYLAEIVIDTREEVCIPMVWTPAIRVDEQEQGIWKCVLSTDELLARHSKLMEIIKLPLEGPYADVVRIHCEEVDAALEMRRKGRRTITKARLRDRE